MKIILTIAQRELTSFFDSLIAYIMLGVFLGFSGFFTWLYGNDIFLVGQASLSVFFSIASWTLFFFIPAITMKMLAEEKRSGTIELMLTKSVSLRELVGGKFLGALSLVIIALVATLPYIITLANIGNLDNGGTITGYLALFLMSMAYTAIGIFTSSITNNQIVSFLLALLISLFFQIIFDVLAGSATGFMGQLFDTLSLRSHFESISRGVVDSKDLIYFLSLTAIGLVLTEWSLMKNR